MKIFSWLNQRKPRRIWTKTTFVVVCLAIGFLISYISQKNDWKYDRWFFVASIFGPFYIGDWIFKKEKSHEK